MGVVELTRIMRTNEIRASLFQLLSYWLTWRVSEASHPNDCINK